MAILSMAMAEKLWGKAPEFKPSFGITRRRGPKSFDFWKRFSRGVAKKHKIPQKKVVEEPESGHTCRQPH
jgi:hypothetical protein